MSHDTTTIPNRSLGLALAILTVANALGVIALVVAWTFMVFSNNAMTDFRDETRSRLDGITELVEQIETEYEAVSCSEVVIRGVRHE